MMLINKVTKDIKIAYKISLSDAEPFNKKTIANCNITSSIIRKTKNSSFKNEKSKKEVDVTITVSNKDIV
jgi:hypothetical protein